MSSIKLQKPAFRQPNPPRQPSNGETVAGVRSPSPDFLQTILAAMADTVFVVDESGSILYASPNVETVFDFSPKDIVGRAHLESILGLAVQERAGTAGSDRPAVIETPLKDRYGKELTVRVSIRSLPERPGCRLCVCRDITERRQAEKLLHMVVDQLEEEQAASKKKSVALRGVLEQIDEEKAVQQRQIQAHIDKVVWPALRLLQNRLAPSEATYLELVERALQDITSSFVDRLETRAASLSPRELEIATMVREGMSSKEIAALYNLSVQTVIKQRKRIRKKLGINGQDVNLTSYLRSL